MLILDTETGMHKKCPQALEAKTIFKVLDSLLLLLQTTQLDPSELLLELVLWEWGGTMACDWQT